MPSSSPNACVTTALRTSRTPPQIGPSSTWMVLGAFRGFQAALETCRDALAGALGGQR